MRTNFGLLPAGDLLRDLGDLLLLEGLLHQYHIPHVSALCNAVVEGPHRLDACIIPHLVDSFMTWKSLLFGVNGARLRGSFREGIWMTKPSS